MLQVEKKKRRGGRKWILWAALGAVAAACALIAVLAPREAEPLPVREETGGAIANRETREIRWVRIQMRGQEEWTAERSADGEMVIAGGDGWALDETLGERMEDALAHPVYEDILTENPEEYRDRLADFGLEDPSLIAEVQYTDGTGMTLRFGDDSGIGDEDFRYMTVDGDPRLYAVAGSLMEDLSVERAMLHPVKQPDIQNSRMDRITLRDAAGEIRAEWALSGQITDSDAAANWRVTVPVSYPADQDQATGLRKNAANLRMGMYVAEGTAAQRAKYGLEDPAWEIEVHLAAGATGQITAEGAYDVREMEEESFRFLIGNARNEMTDYCLYSGTIYTINHFTVSALTETDPMDTLARYPMTVAAENIQSLEVEKADGSVDRYELTRAAAPAGGAEGTEDRTETAGEGGAFAGTGMEAEEGAGEEGIVILCEKNGESMEYSAFEAAWERMRTVDVSGQLPEGWEKKETKMRYTVRTLSGKIHTVELSDFDAMHDAVTVDGWTLFYLIKGGMPEMP